MGSALVVEDGRFSPSVVLIASLLLLSSILMPFQRARGESGTVWTSETIDGDVVWGPEDSPVYLVTNLTILSESTLTIEPGTRVVIDQWARIQVYGKLIVNGTQSDLVEINLNLTSQIPHELDKYTIEVHGTAFFHHMRLVGETLGGTDLNRRCIAYMAGADGEVSNSSFEHCSWAVATWSPLHIIGNSFREVYGAIGGTDTENITIANNNISAYRYGIDLDNTSNVLIEKNVVDAGTGIDDSGARNHTYVGNEVIRKERDYSLHDTGIYVFFATELTIHRNEIRGYETGIFITRTADTVISENNITENSVGINVAVAQQNTLVYHNNFIRNGESAYTIVPGSVLFYQCQSGNYWSDYTGKDGDGDGIGDQPYVIRGDLVDPYPLMEPHVWGQEYTCRKAIDPSIIIASLVTLATILTIIVLFLKRRKKQRPNTGGDEGDSLTNSDIRAGKKGSSR